MESLTLVLIKETLKQVARQGEGGTEGFLEKGFLERIRLTLKDAVLGGKATSVLTDGTGTTGIMKRPC